MHIKRIVLSALLLGFLMLPVGSLALPVQVHAATETISKQQACAGLNQLQVGIQSDCDNLEQKGNGVTRVVKAIVQILSWVVGIVAVIMILIAGLKYITSGGDSGKMGSAKSTLVYALVGLFIAALAQFLVTFVLSNS